MAAASGGNAAHKLFQHAAVYAKYRPNYPASVLTKLASLVADGLTESSVAVDIATGTGQALAGLSEHFAKIIAVEASSAQCKQAAEAAASLGSVHEVHEGFAETFLKDTGMAAGSADVVTAFQAAHWFQLSGECGFYAEAAKALRPGGVVALVGYGNCTIKPATDEATGATGAEAAQATVTEFYDGLLGEYWDERRRLVDAHYVGMEPQDVAADESSPWVRVWRDDSEAIERRMPLDAFLGYLSSWSAYQTYRAKHAEEADPLEQVGSNLQAALGEGDVIVTWPLFCIFAEKRR